MANNSLFLFAVVLLAFAIPLAVFFEADFDVQTRSARSPLPTKSTPAREKTSVPTADEPTFKVKVPKSFQRFVKDRYIVTMKKKKSSSRASSEIQGASVAASALEAEGLTDYFDVQDHINRHFGTNAPQVKRSFSAASIDGQQQAEHGGEGQASSGKNVVEQIFPTGYVAKMDNELVKRIKNDQSVASVERDRPLVAYGIQTNPKNWGLDRIDQQTPPYDRQYDFPNGGDGVDIYILDDGVNIGLDEFRGRAFFGANFVNHEQHTQSGGHGTHCASIAAGTEYGVAKMARIWSVKVLGSHGWGRWSDTYAGIYWAVEHHLERKAKGLSKGAVLSMSLGGEGVSGADHESVNYAVSNGIPVIVAAGNEDDNACKYSPSGVPAAYAVAASTFTDARADFSNWGSCVDIFAPGRQILAYLNTGNPDLWSGTSMATPHVSGVAAIMLASQNLTAAQLYSRLNSFAVEGQVKDAKRSPNRLLQVKTDFSVDLRMSSYSEVNKTATIVVTTASASSVRCNFQAESLTRKAFVVSPSNRSSVTYSPVVVSFGSAKLENFRFTANCTSGRTNRVVSAAWRWRNYTVNISSSLDISFNNQQSRSFLLSGTTYIRDESRFFLHADRCIFVSPSVSSVLPASDASVATRFSFRSHCFATETTDVGLRSTFNDFDIALLQSQNTIFEVVADVDEISLSRNEMKRIGMRIKSGPLPITSFSTENIGQVDVTSYETIGSSARTYPFRFSQGPEFVCESGPAYYGVYYNAEISGYRFAGSVETPVTVNLEKHSDLEISVPKVVFPSTRNWALMRVNALSIDFTLPSGDFLSPLMTWVYTEGCVQFDAELISALSPKNVFANVTHCDDAPSAWTQNVAIYWFFDYCDWKDVELVVKFEKRS